MNSLKNVLFANRTETVCSSRPDEASQSDREKNDDTSVQDGSLFTGQEIFVEHIDSSSDSLYSEKISINNHLRGYDTDMHIYYDDKLMCGYHEDSTMVETRGIAADEMLQECYAQIEDEREKYMNKVSEISVLKTELVCMADELREQREHVARLKSSEEKTKADLRERTYDLTMTLKHLSRESASSAEKIARLEEDRRELKDTIGRAGDEVNALTAELEHARAEHNRSLELLKHQNCLINKNESLKRELDDAENQLIRLKSEQTMSVEKSIRDGIAAEDLRCTIDRLEHELGQSTAARHELQQRMDNQKQDAVNCITDMAGKLNSLKRENAELNTRLEKLSETKSVDVGLQTDLPSAQCDDVSECSCSVGSTDHDCISNYSKKEKIQELQRQLDEMKELYRNKEQNYQQTIEALEKKVAKNKIHRRNLENEFKSDIKIKDHLFAETLEEFKGIVRDKTEIIDFERNSCMKMKKQLRGQNILLELEKQNAHDLQIKFNDRIGELVEENAVHSKKVVELTNYIQELSGQQAKTDKPRKLTKTSKPVVHSGYVAAKSGVPKYERNTSKLHGSGELRKPNAIKTQTAVHPECKGKQNHNGRTGKPKSILIRSQSDFLRMLEHRMQKWTNG